MGMEPRQELLYGDSPLQDQPLISVRGLEKSFPSCRVLRDITFSICPGEIVGLLGLNGAGRTTLVKLLCGLLLPDRGEIQIAGEPLGREPVRRCIAVMKEGQPSWTQRVDGVPVCQRGIHNASARCHETFGSFHALRGAGAALSSRLGPRPGVARFSAGQPLCSHYHFLPWMRWAVSGGVPYWSMGARSVTDRPPLELLQVKE